MALDTDTAQTSKLRLLAEEVVARAVRAGAGLGELLDLAETDVDGELFALEAVGFESEEFAVNVRLGQVEQLTESGSGANRTGHDLLGEEAQLRGLGCVCVERHSDPSLVDGAARDAQFLPVGGGEEADRIAAVLGVGLGLVRDVRPSALGRGALVQLHFAVAVLAAELGVAVDERFGDGLYLPERFISAGGANTPALYFALVNLFFDYCCFACHGALLATVGGACVGYCIDSTLMSSSDV